MPWSTVIALPRVAVRCNVGVTVCPAQAKLASSLPCRVLEVPCTTLGAGAGSIAAVEEASGTGLAGGEASHIRVPPGRTSTAAWLPSSALELTLWTSSAPRLPCSSLVLTRGA